MATKPTPSDRSSIVASSGTVARPPCTIHSLAIIGDRVQITGTHSVEIGENTVIHPWAKIKAEGGKVLIGRNCIVCEGAVIGVSDSDGVGGVKIGDGVNIEAGAMVESQSVDDWTVIEAKTKLGKGSIIGKHCKISPLNEILPLEQLPDYTVVYGYNQRRTDQTMASNAEVREAKEKGQDMHIQLLKRLIPDASIKWKS